MFSAVKEVLTKELEVKDIKDFLEMEIEIKKLKELLATEVKLKEFLLQEINVTDVLPQSLRKSLAKKDDEKDSKNQKIKKVVTSDDSKESNKKEEMATPKLLLPTYDYMLIEKLHTDHEELIFIYRELMKNAKAKKYSLVTVDLERLTSRITEHYSMADKELYNYLKIFIQQKFPKRVKAFNELSLEMKNLSLSIFFSISQSPNIPLRDETYDNFMEEFNQLGVLLRTRINREKQVLFKMYEESHEAKDISGAVA